MDEISMFTKLRPAAPAPATAEAMRVAVRQRLTRVLAEPAAPVRRRSWLPAATPKRALMAGAIATAAAAAIVVPAVLPGSANSPFATKAWAVERHPDGTVTLTLDQEFANLDGLQATLRAAGVPAIVSVIPWKITRLHGGIRASQACGYGSLDVEPRAVEQKVITHPEMRAYVAYASHSGELIVSKARAKPWMRSEEFPDQSVSVIHPSAMPQGSILFITGSPSITSEGIAGTVSDPIMVLRDDHLPACIPGRGASEWHSR